MLRRTCRCALIVLVAMAVNGIAIRLAAASTFPAPQGLFAYALLFAEVGLVAVWSGLSAAPWWRRVAGHSAAVATGMLAAEAIHANHGAWLALFAVQSVSITGPLLLARRMGLRLTRNIDAPRAAPFQFTLRHLFMAMTTFAVLLGLGRVFYPLLRPHSHVAGHIAFEACLLGAGFASVALIATWVALGAGGRIVKLVVFVAATFAVGCLLAAIEPGTQITDEIAIIAMVAMQATMLGCALAAFRRAGYRLIRIRNQATPAEPAAQLQ